MPTLDDLADVLIACRIITAEQWDEAVLIAGDDLPLLLDTLAAGSPPWWDGSPPAPPGLTDYQRGIIEHRFESDELPYLRHDLALNQILLLEKLGQGGQGAVYRGRQLNPARVVAIKTLIRETEVRRRRFEQEARTMMRIRHPAVARFHTYERVRDADDHPTDEYLIAMEFVNGTPLHKLIRRIGPVPWPFTVRWAVQLLGGLAVIHEAGLVHRDVKPENVMVTGPLPEPGVAPETTSVKLLDFGVVKRADEAGEGAITRGKVFIGTMEYAPPEQWDGEAVAASDLYALGGLLFYTLTGHSPYQQETRDLHLYREAHFTADPPDVCEFNPEVPAAVGRLLQQMLAKEPDERGPAAELIEAFRRLQPRKAKSSSAHWPVPRRPAAAVAPPRTPSPGRKPAPPPRPRGVVDVVLAVPERIFLPAYLRPPHGQEPPALERLLVLLRRPAVLLLLVALTAVLIYLVVV